MKRFFETLWLLMLVVLPATWTAAAEPESTAPIKAFCIDFNWENQ
jgi:hypothetical protein